MNIIKIHSKLQRKADERLLVWNQSLPEDNDECIAFINKEFGENSVSHHIIEDLSFKFFCEELAASDYTDIEKSKLFRLGKVFHDSVVSQRKIVREVTQEIE